MHYNWRRWCGRDPGLTASLRRGWPGALANLALPGAGIALYLLLGEVNPGRRAVARMRTVEAILPRAQSAGGAAPDLSVTHRAVFGRAAAINGFTPVAGNTAQQGLADTIAQLVADIDAATCSVHIRQHALVLMTPAGGR